MYEPVHIWKQITIGHRMCARSGAKFIIADDFVFVLTLPPKMAIKTNYAMRPGRIDAHKIEKWTKKSDEDGLRNDAALRHCQKVSSAFANDR